MRVSEPKKGPGSYIDSIEFSLWLLCLGQGHLPLLPLAGEGWALAVKARAFRPRSGRVHLSSLSKKDGTRKKTPQRLRFQHIHVLKVRAWRRAVSTAHPCTDETMADIVSATLRAIPPPCAATQGPNSSGHPARGSKKLARCEIRLRHRCAERYIQTGVRVRRPHHDQTAAFRAENA